MQYNRIAAIAGVLALAFVLAAAGPMSKSAFAAAGGNGNGGGNGGNNNNNGNQLAANNQSVTTNENTAVAITLTGNGPSGFTYVVDTQPANGVLSGTAPNLTYTPNTNYDGADSFTFHTAKNAQSSTIATVSITVNNVPLNCDPGFHEENNACVADEVSGGGTGDNGTGTGGSGDNGSGSGSGSGDSGSGSGDSGSGSSGGDSGSGSGSGDSGSGSGDNGSGDNQQPPAPVAGGRGGYYGAVSHIAASLQALDGPIPSDNSISMYQLAPMNGVLFASMDGVDSAFGAGTWNGLSEGQQVWVVLHFDELVAGP